MTRAKVDVVGAGLAGTLMGCLLGRRGFEVDIHEKRPDPRGGRAAAGKSINLALSTRGLHALDRIGIAETVLKDAVPMRGRMMHAPDGALTFQPYGKSDAEVIHSVSRAGLNIALLDEAEKTPGVRVFFERKCVGAELEKPSAFLENGSSPERIRTEGDVLVGSDGAFSAVRGEMQRAVGFNYRQDFLEHGYKELSIPPGKDGGFRMEKNALHIWPRGSFMMIALPNADGSFTVTLFWPLKGERSFETLDSPETVRAFFEETFPDAVPLIPDLESQFRENPVGSLVTVRCSPFHREGKVVLLGDAAHAVVPFYGQGMNASFEDCAVLDDCLEASREDFSKAFPDYTRRRKENVDALADLALHNFIEMRDHTASAVFLLKKIVERLLSRLLPFLFIPLYSMVTFTRIPYAEAVRRARTQNRWIGALLLCGALLAAFLLR